MAEIAEIGRANIQPLAEETEPPDPRDAFSEEASNRLEQDILLAKKFGVRVRKSRLSQRVERYKKYMTQLGADTLDVVKKYKQQVLEAAACMSAPSSYVPGADIVGDSLRSIRQEPVISGPLVCQLCDDASFAYDVEPLRKRRRVLNDEADAGAAQPSEDRCSGSASRSVGVLRRPASAARCGVGSASQPAQF